MGKMLVCQSLEPATVKVILNVHTHSGASIGLDFTGLSWIVLDGRIIIKSRDYKYHSHNPQRLEKPRILLRSLDIP